MYIAVYCTVYSSTSFDLTILCMHALRSRLDRLPTYVRTYMYIASYSYRGAVWSGLRLAQLRYVPVTMVT